MFFKYIALNMFKIFLKRIDKQSFWFSEFHLLGENFVLIKANGGDINHLRKNVKIRELLASETIFDLTKFQISY